MHRIFVVNAGGFAEPGGGVVEKKDGKVDREVSFKNKERENGLTEGIISSLFGALPSEAGYIPDNNPGAIEWLKGFINDDFAAARKAFKKRTDDELYNLTDEEKVKEVGDFFFAKEGPSDGVTILTVAAPNFAMQKDKQSQAFKAGQVEYKTSYNNYIAESIEKSYRNIFDHFTENAKKGDKLYLYDIGTDIFSPNDQFNYKYKEQQYEGKEGYKEFVQKIEKEVFLEYRDRINKKDLVVCSKCLSKLNTSEKGGAKIEGHKKIFFNSFTTIAKIAGGAKKAVTRPKGSIDDAIDDTHDIVRILNAKGFNIGGKKVILDNNVGKSEIYQSTELDELGGTELDVSKFTLTQRSTAQAIFSTDRHDSKFIVHNFANDETIGGGPGITKNRDGIFHRIRGRSKAQEESLCMKSTLFAALSEFAEKYSSTNALRYNDSFKNQSTSKSIISEGVSFFGTDPTDTGGYIDWGKAGSETKYLDQVKKVDVVTVAAKRYNGDEQNNIADTVRRIREQLAASAHLARENHEGDKKSHIVMGAFGCGAFNNDPKLIASIYRKFLGEGGEFNKAFPENTTFEFAIPLSNEERKIVESVAKDTTRYPNVANYRAFDEYFIQMTRHGDEDKIEQAIVDTKRERLAAEEAEVVRKAEAEKNKIQPLQNNDIQNVEFFMKWNKNSYKKLKEDPKNENNLNLFLNPQTADQTKVFAGWGGRLQHENGNIFTITNVLKGGFADAIGLKQGDKIEIDLNNDDFKKDGAAPFEEKMLEAALINKLRAGELSGIKKIGNINISEENRGGIEGLYKKNQRLFTNDNIEPGKDLEVDEINKFLKNNLNNLIETYIDQKSKESRIELEKCIYHIDKQIRKGPVVNTSKIQGHYLEGEASCKLVLSFIEGGDLILPNVLSEKDKHVKELTSIKNSVGYQKYEVNSVEKDNKRSIIITDGAYTHCICQERKDDSSPWKTVLFDVQGSNKDEIENTFDISGADDKINKTGFIVHDGTCGIGAACMAVYFFNNGGELVNEAGKKHKEVWGDILKLKEASPSTTPASPTVGVRSISR